MSAFDPELGLIGLGILGAALMVLVITSGPSVARHRTSFDDPRMQVLFTGLCFLVGVMLLFWSLLLVPVAHAIFR